MDNNVVVYTQKNCQPCAATKRALKKNHIPFEEVESTDAIREELRLEGWQSFPIVKVLNGAGKPVEAWSGYRLERIKALGGSN